MRDYNVYVYDILGAIKKIRAYTKGMARYEFIRNSLVVDAVVRNLEIIGEASKRLPADIKRQAPDVPWQKIVGLRNMLIHEYSGIDKEIVWDIIENKLDVLSDSLKILSSNRRPPND